MGFFEAWSKKVRKVLLSMQAPENWEALSLSRQEEFIKFAQTLMT